MKIITKIWKEVQVPNTEKPMARVHEKTYAKKLLLPRENALFRSASLAAFELLLAAASAPLAAAMPSDDSSERATMLHFIISRSAC